MKLADEMENTIERACQNDPDALDALIDAYSARLYAFLFRMTAHRNEAEDLVQEVFVRLVMNIGRYEHKGRFEPWLFRIAANLARDRGRRISRTPNSVSWDANPDADSQGISIAEQTCDSALPAPDRPLEHSEDVDRLQVALENLPATEKEVIMLRHYSDLTFAEIAEALSIPLGTALARSHRGLAKLRTLMEPTS